MCEEDRLNSTCYRSKLHNTAKSVYCEVIRREFPSDDAAGKVV